MPIQVIFIALVFNMFHFTYYPKRSTVKSNLQENYLPGDTIKWSKDYRLDYSDFQGIPNLYNHANAPRDTFAISACSITYRVDLHGGKRTINAYAIFIRNLSWIIRKSPRVLNHEQGHFDIAAIFAKKFERIANECNIPDLREYMISITSSFKEIIQQFNQEQEKYDNWTMNTLGVIEYSKWLKNQLDSL